VPLSCKRHIPPKPKEQDSTKCPSRSIPKGGSIWRGTNHHPDKSSLSGCGSSQPHPDRVIDSHFPGRLPKGGKGMKRGQSNQRSFVGYEHDFIFRVGCRRGVEACIDRVQPITEARDGSRNPEQGAGDRLIDAALA